MYKDLNGDGVVNTGGNTVDNPGDRSIIGNSTPPVSYTHLPVRPVLRTPAIRY